MRIKFHFVNYTHEVTKKQPYIMPTWHGDTDFFFLEINQSWSWLDSFCKYPSNLSKWEHNHCIIRFSIFCSKNCLNVGDNCTTLCVMFSFLLVAKHVDNTYTVFLLQVWYCAMPISVQRPTTWSLEECALTHLFKNLISQNFFFCRPGSWRVAIWSRSQEIKKHTHTHILTHLRTCSLLHYPRIIAL